MVIHFERGDGGGDVALTESLDFPVESDDWVTTSTGYMWEVGHYVAGSRATSLSLIDQVDLFIEIESNILSCDSDVFTVLIEGETVGTFEVFADDTSVSASFTLDSAIAVVGDVDIVYEVAETVDSGCGSVNFGDSANTLTLSGGGSGPVTLTSDGTEELPWCSWSYTCEWDDAMKEECAAALCAASGYETGTFISSDVDPCTTSTSDELGWMYSVDEDDYILETGSDGSAWKESVVTAECE